MTKKEQQILENNHVEELYEIFRQEEPALNGCSVWHRLYQCTAWYTDTDRYIVLKSYNTIVAFIDREYMYGVDFSRLVYGYTATTSQRIAKFFSKHGITQRFTYKGI